MGSRYNSMADIHFSVIPREDRTNSVLIMFEPHPIAAEKTANTRKTNTGNRKR
jgi:hypothetical protein